MLYDLPQQAQITLNADVKNDLNRKIILVTGSDRYQQASSIIIRIQVLDPPLPQPSSNSN